MDLHSARERKVVWPITDLRMVFTGCFPRPAFHSAPSGDPESSRFRVPWLSHLGTLCLDQYQILSAVNEPLFGTQWEVGLTRHQAQKGLHHLLSLPSLSVCLPVGTLNLHGSGSSGLYIWSPSAGPVPEPHSKECTHTCHLKRSSLVLSFS